MVKFLSNILTPRMETSGDFYIQLKQQLGLQVKNKSIYQRAFIHPSLNQKDDSGTRINFERLEFLGDALLNAVVAAFLFEEYPKANEGKLTQMRAQIVSREQLNSIGKKLNLVQWMQTGKKQNSFGEDVHGNLLESLLGALLIDKGYEKSKRFIIDKIIQEHIDMDSLNDRVLSYKSALIEWAQKNKITYRFETKEDEGFDPKVNYSSSFFIDQKQIAKARDISKKKAEEKVAKRGYYALKIKSLSQ